METEWLHHVQQPLAAKLDDELAIQTGAIQLPKQKTFDFEFQSLNEGDVCGGEKEGIKPNTLIDLRFVLT